MDGVRAQRRATEGANRRKQAATDGVSAPLLFLKIEHTSKF